MKSTPFALFALAAAFAGAAAAQTQLMPAQSDISFTSKQMGVPVNGRFAKFAGQVVFDPKAPAAARIGLTIDLGSVVLGTAEVESEVAKPDWFHTRMFPQATFQSTAVRPAGAGRFDVEGKLTIKGASRDVIVPVSLAQSGGRTTATGAFVIQRLDFRIGDGDWKDVSLVADAVQVQFRLVLSGIAAL